MERKASSSRAKTCKYHEPWRRREGQHPELNRTFVQPCAQTQCSRKVREKEVELPDSGARTHTGRLLWFHDVA